VFYKGNNSKKKGAFDKMMQHYFREINFLDVEKLHFHVEFVIIGRLRNR
jgi:hypothetical protein